LPKGGCQKKTKKIQKPSRRPNATKIKNERNLEKEELTARRATVERKKKENRYP